MCLNKCKFIILIGIIILILPLISYANPVATPITPYIYGLCGGVLLRVYQGNDLYTNYGEPGPHGGWTDYRIPNLEKAYPIAISGCRVTVRAISDGKFLIGTYRYAKLWTLFAEGHGNFIGPVMR